MKRLHTKKAYEKIYNIHDPQNEFVWVDDKLPIWVMFLKGLAFIGGTFGTVYAAGLFVYIMMSL